LLGDVLSTVYCIGLPAASDAIGLGYGGLALFSVIALFFLAHCILRICSFLFLWSQVLPGRAGLAGQHGIHMYISRAMESIYEAYCSQMESLMVWPVIRVVKMCSMLIISLSARGFITIVFFV
jgi:hypothetical protein